MSIELQPEGCGVLIMDPSQKYCLLMERNPNYVNNTGGKSQYEYPGGKAEPADVEPYLSTAVREVFEEIGLELCIDHVRKSPRVVSKSPKGLGVGLYLVTLDDDLYKRVEQNQLDFKIKFQQSPNEKMMEGVGLVWVPIEDLKSDALGGTQKLALPLRAFNKIMIKMLIDQQIL